ncbi:MAG: hypothetical protein H6741_23630 [Alphaproteobacteria bacterium]|nr:hypothetical protein [Alphaproteobacteria bacterium]MCB9795699.1 hypothetical protein [Alphaproteobacteria bacterium]
MLLLTLAALPLAQAAVPDTFGHGPANSALAGAATARADDPFAAYYNPAGLGQIAYPTLSMGVLKGQANLAGFEGIVYDTNADGALVDELGAPDYGDVGTDYRVWDPDNPNPFYLDGNVIGAAFPILNQWLRDQNNQVLKNLRVTLGMAAFLPTQTTLRMQMQDPYTPYYVMFRNRNDQFTVHPAVGVHVFRGVYLGAGAQVMTDISARIRLASYTTAESFPNEQGDDEIRVLVTSQVEDMQLNVAPRSAPTFGFLFKPAELLQSDPSTTAGRVLSHTSFGFNYRGAWYSGTSADVLVYANGKISFDDETILLSSMLEEPIEVELRDLVSLYNPPMMTLGFKTGFGDGGLAGNGVDVSVDLVRTEWSKFTETVSPYQEMRVEALTGASVSILVGTDYGDPGFTDTWTPKVGASWSRCWSRCGRGPKAAEGIGFGTVLRAGYSFVPTPVPDQNRYTNYMDSDRHVFAGGLGVELLNKGVGPIVFDLGGQYLKLNERTMQKDGDLVADFDGDGTLDFTRGYPLAGEITSAGSLWMVTAGVELTFGANEKARERTQRVKDTRPVPGIVPLPPGEAYQTIDPVQEQRELGPAKAPAEAPEAAPVEAPAEETPAPETGDTPAGPSEETE